MSFKPAYSQDHGKQEIAKRCNHAQYSKLPASKKESFIQICVFNNSKKNTSAPWSPNHPSVYQTTACKEWIYASGEAV